METERLACPMCGWWRTKNFGIGLNGEPREVRFDKMDVETAPMWRLERLIGAGRASKKATIVTLETKRLSELPDEMKAQIREQCQKILRILEEILPEGGKG